MVPLKLEKRAKHLWFVTMQGHRVETLGPEGLLEGIDAPAT